MKALLPNVDPEGLREFSVVFTDRSLNHMSQKFQGVMRDISASLKQVYCADHVVLVPGGGTFAMEAVARQFAIDADVLVIRNGWFSYRWTQILDAGHFHKSQTILKAHQTGNSPTSPFAPTPAEEVANTIRDQRPSIVFAPHVETSSGIILPDAYLKTVADAVHKVGGLFVVDCIASGCVWLDMKSLGIDVLISAPQKGWSASPCAGMVMLSEAAHETMKLNDSNSFAVNLKAWSGIMDAYENGGHAYYATLPTDSLVTLHDAIAETAEWGFDEAKAAQWDLGTKVRALLTSRGITSVAADGFGAPGVVVSYTGNPEIKNGSAFAKNGTQIAAGVPLQCDEPEGFSTFRLGLFGLDKLRDVDATVATLTEALDAANLK